MSSFSFPFTPELKVGLAALYHTWAAADPLFAEVAEKYPGVRILRQDPVENVFSFICSANNHISRQGSLFVLLPLPRQQLNLFVFSLHFYQLKIRFFSISNCKLVFFLQYHQLKNQYFLSLFQHIWPKTGLTINWVFGTYETPEQMLDRVGKKKKRVKGPDAANKLPAVTPHAKVVISVLTSLLVNERGLKPDENSLVNRLQ